MISVVSIRAIGLVRAFPNTQLMSVDGSRLVSFAWWSDLTLDPANARVYSDCEVGGVSQGGMSV